MAAWPHGDPDAVVRAILATAPYAHAKPEVQTPQKSTDIVGLLWNWFVDHVLRPLLRAIASHLPRDTGGFGNAAQIVEYALVAVAAAIVAFVVYRLIVAFARPGQSDRRLGGANVPLASMLSSEQWRARAAQAARAGDYGRAIAALFTAALATLDERALVAFDATRTPGEYRRLVRRERAPASEPFNDLCSRFVRAAYAEVVTTADDYAAAERAYATFEPATTPA